MEQIKDKPTGAQQEAARNSDGENLTVEGVRKGSGKQQVSGIQLVGFPSWMQNRHTN